MAQESEKLSFSFDMNDFMKAYQKEAFMKNVFIGYLKENPEIVSSVIGDYVLRDLIKSDFIESITEKTKAYIEKSLTPEELDRYNSSIKKEIIKVACDKVSVNAHMIDGRVKQSIQSEATKERIISVVKSTIQEKIMLGFSRLDLSDDEYRDSED